ncbi:MAG: MBL fold metallo-hydrolase [Alphaproteobacteria bacterium]|nr:MBL fold metallo-hydrolase [Alphaproteobacteria bacterium]
MKITILGCGSSGGVPRIGNDWGACDPAEPRNRRSRCSILAQHEGTTVLVDTSPDLRQQLLDVAVDRIDGVIYTHDHADQTHGIDDLRVLALRRRDRVDIYGDAYTLASLRGRFGYIFETPPGSGYPPIARCHEIGPGTPVTIAGLEIGTFGQRHGEIDSLGLRFGAIAYSCDLNGLAEDGFAALAGVRVWIVDALRYRPHPSHAHLDQTLEWIGRVKPERAILTNLHVDMDYRTLCAELPPGVEPAYDGMVIEV